MEFLRFAIIHIGVPAAGSLVYLWLRNRMRKENIEEPPDIALFILFVTYGGWLMEALTLLFWRWSGMALLGIMYLAFIAPVVMIVLAIKLYPKRKLSPYHRGSFIACAVYALLPIPEVIWMSMP
ncbi:MAG: hypothetical protein JMDDDDMK_01588 [Acidobacteria bacterium]|nr:hypothetical protein [Acidobacteriota bacterium]